MKEEAGGSANLATPSGGPWGLANLAQFECTCDQQGRQALANHSPTITDHRATDSESERGVARKRWRKSSKFTIEVGQFVNGE